MDVLDALNRFEGVARVDSVRRLGVSDHALRRARQQGVVRSVRRGWIARTDADRMLVVAASRGVVLSCVTLAARRGLWVRDAAKLHVAAPPRSGHVKVPSATVHWSRPLFPRHPDACEDSIENALVLIASCQPFEAALVVWESALSRGIVDSGVLKRTPLPPAARRVLDQATPFADAGTETIFRTRLRWLRVPILPQAWLMGHRVDFLIGERLVVQIDGGHHVGPQRTNDIAHDAQLMLHGYHVIRISYEQLMQRWPEVQAVVMAAIAQGLHLAA